MQIDREERHSRGWLGKSIRVLAVTAIAVPLLGLAVTHPLLKPRIEFVVEKMSGRTPDMSWRNIARNLLPKNLRSDRNIYLSTRNSHNSEADVLAGAEKFRSQCGACHGATGQGGIGADLTKGSYKHGSSDLAIYESIQKGVSGTAMLAFDLPEREAWQLVAYLRTISSLENTKDSEDPKPDRPGPGVSYSRLLNARDEPGNWLSYAGGYDSHRFSPLSAIDTGNVKKLEVRWVYQLDTAYSRVAGSPLVVDGVIYTTGPNGSAIALDAATGEELWIFERNPGESLPLCCGRSNRGMAVLGDSLYLGTLDANLIALDARTGKALWEIEVGDPALGYTITVAPLALDNKIIVGISGGEFGIRGFIDAYDAQTGERLWRRHTIPAAGERGNETWEGDSWKKGGAPTWKTGSFDPELNLLYWGVGNPGPVYSGLGREGDNLYSNSVLAIDADTGEIRWHFQFTPHDTHDWDANQAPILVDRDWNGAQRKLIIWANRNGFFYVLDRETGEFLLAEQFARQTWAEGIDANGRPIEIPGKEPNKEGIVVFPGASGATNWWPPSYSRQTKLLYVPVLEWGTVYFSSGTKADHSPGEFLLGSTWTALPIGHGRVLVRAIDPATGLTKWEHEMPGGLSNRPHLSRRLPGVLSTAGGLVFGADRTRFVAMDAEQGFELWSHELGGHIVASAVSYEAGGEQFLSIAAGRSVFGYALRTEPTPPEPDEPK